MPPPYCAAPDPSAISSSPHGSFCR
jgi:hypothetical protein